MNKFKNAVIHLECATDSESSQERINRLTVLKKELDDGKISISEYTDNLTSKSRDVRFQGTAIFLTNNNKRYLITARHVLWDELSAKREYQETINRSAKPDSFLLKYAEESCNNKIFNIIFRVQSLNEYLQGRFNSVFTFLMNLGAGTHSSVPYTFSRPDIDVAVISLDRRNSEFADELISVGYQPIDFEDISPEPSAEGVEVYSVGYPSSTALLGQISQHPAIANWSSSFFSLPVFSFGHISMLHKNLPFFWVDMSIYPGNSGGPIIENEKLVGIVVGQPTIPIEGKEHYETRIPFGKIIKSAYVKEILDIQFKKDELDRER